MPQYKMPDGDIYIFDSDAEAASFIKDAYSESDIDLNKEKPKVKDKPMSGLDAVKAGFKGVSRAVDYAAKGQEGNDLEEYIKWRQEIQEPAERQRPIYTVIGNAGAKILGAVGAGAAPLLAGPGGLIASVPMAAGAFGAIGGAEERADIAYKKQTRELNNQDVSAIDARQLFDTAGGAMGAGTGGLASRLVTAGAVNAALGSGNRIARNEIYEDDPKFYQDAFDPKGIAADAAFGAAPVAAHAGIKKIHSKLTTPVEKPNNELVESNLNTDLDVTEQSLKSKLDSNKRVKENLEQKLRYDPFLTKENREQAYDYHDRLSKDILTIEKNLKQVERERSKLKNEEAIESATTTFFGNKSPEVVKQIASELKRFYRLKDAWAQAQKVESPDSKADLEILTRNPQAYYKYKQYTDEERLIPEEMEIVEKNLIKLGLSRQEIDYVGRDYNPIDYKSLWEVGEHPRQFDMLPESNVRELFPKAPKPTEEDKATLQSKLEEQAIAQVDVQVKQSKIANIIETERMSGDFLSTSIRIPGVRQAVNAAGGVANAVTRQTSGLLQRGQGLVGHPLLVHVKDTVYSGLKWKDSFVHDMINGYNNLTWEDKIKLPNGKWGINLSKTTGEKSPKALLKKSTNTDVYKVMQVFQKGRGVYTYWDNLAINGNNLTDGQKELYKSLAKMFGNMLSEVRNQEFSLLKKNLTPYTLGWFPAVRKGKYYVSVSNKAFARPSGFNKELNETEFSNTVHTEYFRTQKEAEYAQQRIKDSYKDQLDKVHIVVDKREKNADNIYMNKYIDAVREEFQKEMGMNTLNPKLGSFKEAEDILTDVAEVAGIRGGTLGGHHKIRSDITGYKGSEKGVTIEKAGNSFREAIFDSVDEYGTLMYKLKVSTELNLLEGSSGFKELGKHTQAAFTSMKNHALNENRKLFGEDNFISDFKEAIDDGLSAFISTTIHTVRHPIRTTKMLYKGEQLPIEWGKVNRVDNAVAGFGSVFYKATVLPRAIMWAGQIIQPLFMTRALARKGVPLYKAMVHAYKGAENLIKPSKQYLEDATYIAQTYPSTFEPSFVNDLNTFVHNAQGIFREEGTLNKTQELITGTSPAALADKMSRAWAWSMAYESYKAMYISKGMSEKNAGRRARMEAMEDTDVNMVQYGNQFKAPMWDKLGMIGNIMSPLSTYPQAMTANFLADLRWIFLSKEIRGDAGRFAPLAATSITALLFTGIIGAPFIAAYEAARLFLMEHTNNDEILPTTIELLEKGNSEVNRIILGGNPELMDWGEKAINHPALTHGILGAATLPFTDGEGIDVAATNRYQPIWTSTPVEPLAPVKVAQIIAATYTLFKDSVSDKVLPDDVSAARNTIVPKMYRDFLGTNLNKGVEFSPGLALNSYGKPSVEMTDAVRLAETLGGNTIRQQKEMARNREEKIRMDRQTRIAKPIVDKYIQNLYLANTAKEQGQNKIAESKLRIARAQEEKFADNLITSESVKAKYIKYYIDKRFPKRFSTFKKGTGKIPLKVQVLVKDYEERYGVSPFEVLEREEE